MEAENSHNLQAGELKKVSLSVEEASELRKPMIQIPVRGQETLRGDIPAQSVKQGKKEVSSSSSALCSIQVFRELNAASPQGEGSLLYWVHPFRC